MARVGTNRVCRVAKALPMLWGGVELTCPACAVTGILTVDQAWVLWGEQMRKDRILALAGLVPEDLDRT